MTEWSFFFPTAAHGISFAYYIIYVKPGHMRWLLFAIHSHKGLQIFLDQNQAVWAMGLHIQE